MRATGSSVSALQSDLSSGGEWPGSNLFGMEGWKGGLGDAMSWGDGGGLKWHGKKNSNQGHEERAAV